MMRAVLCFLLLFLLCPQSSGSGFCPDRWLLFKDRCLGVYPVWSTWSTAETLCSQAESHLVSLHSNEELEFVRKLAVRLGVPVWIGGYSMSQSDTWFWSDGSDFSLSVFTNQTSAPRDKDKACLGTTSDDGDVKSAPCGELRFYICSRITSWNTYSTHDQALASSAHSKGLSPGLSLFTLIWDQSESLAEEILQSSSFLLELKSGSITQSCYDRFSQQEALYMGLVYRTLEALTFYIEEADPDVRALLLDTKQLYKTKYTKQDLAAAPRWLQFSLQSFHLVVVDDPVYLLVALSARSTLQTFVFQSLPLPGFVPSSEAKHLYQRWREDGERELQFAQRFKEVIENHQKQMDVFKSINVFKQHLMNQKGLHKHVECVHIEELD